MSNFDSYRNTYLYFFLIWVLPDVLITSIPDNKLFNALYYCQRANLTSCSIQILYRDIEHEIPAILKVIAKLQF